jgi:hypothetical protein
MLVSLPGTATAHAATTPAANAPAVTAPAPGAACNCSPVYNVGADHSVTGLSSAGNGTVTYATWAADRGYRGPSPASGIATNYGGTWHQVGTGDLPEQDISGITADPSNAAHAYAVYDDHSRHDIRGGHVYETWNGGGSWDDISGNLPDLASIVSLVLDHGRLALATDRGIFTAFEFRGGHTSWHHLGSLRQYVAVGALTFGPDNCLYAATRSHGIWRFML